MRWQAYQINLLLAATRCLDMIFSYASEDRKMDFTIGKKI